MALIGLLFFLPQMLSAAAVTCGDLNAHLSDAAPHELLQCDQRLEFLDLGVQQSGASSTTM